MMMLKCDAHECERMATVEFASGPFLCYSCARSYVNMLEGVAIVQEDVDAKVQEIRVFRYGEELAVEAKAQEDERKEKGPRQ